MADKLERVVAWKSLLINGTEYCALWQTDDGWLLKGTAVGVLKDQGPILANYEIHCDVNWLTHRVQAGAHNRERREDPQPECGEPWSVALWGPGVARAAWLP